MTNEMTTEHLVLNASFVLKENSSAVAFNNQTHNFSFGDFDIVQGEIQDSFTSYGGNALVTYKNGKFFDLEFETRVSDFYFEFFVHQDGSIDFKVLTAEKENVTNFFFGYKPNCRGPVLMCRSSEECVESVFFMLSHFVFV